MRDRSVGRLAGLRWNAEPDRPVLLAKIETSSPVGWATRGPSSGGELGQYRVGTGCDLYLLRFVTGRYQGSTWIFPSIGDHDIARQRRRRRVDRMGAGKWRAAAKRAAPHVHVPGRDIDLSPRRWGWHGWSADRRVRRCRRTIGNDATDHRLLRLPAIPGEASQAGSDWIGHRLRGHRSSPASRLQSRYGRCDAGGR